MEFGPIAVNSTLLPHVTRGTRNYFMCELSFVVWIMVFLGWPQLTSSLTHQLSLLIQLVECRVLLSSEQLNQVLLDQMNPPTIVWPRVPMPVLDNLGSLTVFGDTQFIIQTERYPILSGLRFPAEQVQRSPLFCAPGLVKFVPAVARPFCLALPGSFLTMFAQIKGDLWTMH